CARWGGDDYW
nr:immunoglobulin heavy chain junction region [Mus musculus]